MSAATEKTPIAQMLERDDAARERYAESLGELGFLVVWPSKHLFSEHTDTCVLCGCDLQDTPAICDRGYV